MRFTNSGLASFLVETVTVLAQSGQGRGGDELGAEYAKGLERTMYAGLTGRGKLMYNNQLLCQQQH